MSDTHIQTGAFVRMSLRALGLRTGMALQTRRLVEGANKREAQYIGAIEGKGVMVGPQGAEGEQTGSEEGEVCVVRGFTGQYEFSFVSKVLQTFTQPFAYSLLAYPAQVDAQKVRQSLRTKTSWPTKVQVPDKAGKSAPSEFDANLVDISSNGAMILAPTGLASVGDSITVVFSVQIEEQPATLALLATICHNNRASQSEGHFVGLSFKNLSQQDTLALHYLTQKPKL